MNDAVDRVLVERAAEERGFGLGLGVSSAVHAAILVVGVVVPLLFPPQPKLDVTDGFAVALPPGGAGVPNVPNPAPGEAAPAPQPAPPVTQPPAPEPPAPDPKKILKPPKEEPRKGLADPDAKRPKNAKKEAERERVKPGATSTAPRSTSPGLPGATGTTSQTPGLSFGPAGPGVPGGTDPNGDWYLASVQRKIWVIWTQQLRGAAYPPVAISFTIRGDGSVADVRLIESSGIPSVDMAAQRAIFSAAPFGPLPRMYGTDAYTIRAVFKPET